MIRPGDDVTIISTGAMLHYSLQAADQLQERGISARVINLHTIKPLDRACVLEAAARTGALVTAEEHSIVGGLGSAVAEVLSENAPVPLKRVGIADRFAETGPYEELLDRYGMSVGDIVDAARQALAMKA